jgi:hypothetical protein
VQCWHSARETKGIANILSLSRVAKLFQVTFNSEDGFIIHKQDGRKHTFRESTRGLYYLDPSKSSDTVMVTTVADKKQTTVHVIISVQHLQESYSTSWDIRLPNSLKRLPLVIIYQTAQSEQMTLWLQRTYLVKALVP